MLDNSTPSTAPTDLSPVVLSDFPVVENSESGAAVLSSSSVADSLAVDQPAEEPGAHEIVSDSLAVGVMFALVLTVLTRLVGFVRGILFCKLMTDQQLGQWSMVWSLMMMLAPLAVLGLPGCFGRYTEHYRQRGQMRTFFLRITSISIGMTLLMTALVLLAPESMAWLVFRDASHSGIMISVGLALFLVTGLNFLISMMESLRQVRLVTMMRFVLGLVFAIVGCGLMWFWKDGASAATFGYAIACVFAGAPAIWFLWKNRTKIQDTGDKLRHGEMWRRIAPYALWMWWGNMFSNMFEVADRYMLIHWSECSAELAQGLVGQYHSARVVPMLLVSIAVVLEGMILPYMTALWEQNKPKEAGKQSPT